MARRPRGTKTNLQLQGAGEFAGQDTEQSARDKIAEAEAARKASETEKAQDGNGGPIPTLQDEAAWRRAANELKAETLELEELATKTSEVRGRISSIKKVAEKCGVDWDVVQLYNKFDARIRKGGTGEIVTEARRLGALMRYMESPLHTQFAMFPEPPKDDEVAPNGQSVAVMEAELLGQQAYKQGAKLQDNPFNVSTDPEKHNEWHTGWTQAQNHTARTMGPPAGGGEPTTH